MINKYFTQIDYFCKMNNLSKHFLLLVVLFSMVGVFSCTPYQKIVKSTDNDLKYTKAVEYFEQKKYFRTIELLEQIQPFYRGTPLAENIAYYISYSYYNQKDYILAGYYLKMFANNYPSNPKSEEALYLSAFCNYLDSPKSTLDQKPTLDALDFLHNFKKVHPESPLVKECDKLIYELNSKLEKKYFDIAMLYYRMRDYQAAIINFNNILKDYPDTKYKEEIMYHVLLAKYEFAEKSIDSKKQERFVDAVNAYNDLIAGFPNGSYANKANTIKKKLDIINLD